MKEYIEREALVYALCTSTEPFNTGSVMRTTKSQPAADVVERKRGEWIKVGESCGVDLLECPVCHTIHAQDGDAFCRDCGANMRGE